MFRTGDLMAVGSQSHTHTFRNNHYVLFPLKRVIALSGTTGVITSSPMCSDPTTLQSNHVLKKNKKHNTTEHNSTFLFYSTQNTNNDKKGMCEHLRVF